MARGGDHEGAAVLRELAEEAPTTVRQLHARGVDPLHLTGGEQARISFPSTRIGTRKTFLPGQKRAYTGRTVTGLEDVARREIGTAQQYVQNQARELVAKEFG